MVHLRIQRELERQWRSVLEREVNDNLSPIQDRLRNVRIHFVGMAHAGNARQGFRCVLVGRGLGGETYHTEADSADGRMAIHDALLRARQAVDRRPFPPKPQR